MNRQRLEWGTKQTKRTKPKDANKATDETKNVKCSRGYINLKNSSIIAFSLFLIKSSDFDLLLIR